MHGRWRGCGPRGFEGIPEAIIAMGLGGKGWGASWDFGDWSDWGPGGRRGGGRRRMFESGELRLVLLKLIADEPRHGYDLIRAIEELTGGSYAPSPGVVYPTLSMLEDTGLIEELEAEGARKAFAATAEGRAHLEEKAEEVQALIDRLSHLGDRQRRRGRGPVWRAMGNLAVALSHRLSRDDVDDDKLHEVAEMLDDVARRIERL